MWERIRLPKNYAQALALVDKHLEFFPKTLIHRNKQRLTKIHQYLIRMRKLKLKVQPKLVGEPKKIARRERRREQKAEKIALIDRAIKAELVQRLEAGVYGDIYNFPKQVYKDVLEEMGEEKDREIEADDEKELEEEAEGEGDEGPVEFVEDYGEDDDYEDVEGLGDLTKDRDGAGGDSDDDSEKPSSSKPSKKPTRKRRRGAREIEYEIETEVETAK
eukprot:CAMPEP_0184490552 /NCGR_PEP_ID=MMETSP0113_2-20130426/18125_1 /TAXON_ID=91329 /ORGANISM="Norrisiella sphaerica, Strain BC52" /LENGTH=217 /DNA_ID=CAMNT_0026874475 /DNA_START=547 /DNA_END=1200 /DNA_ORIENTATION=-